MVGPWSFLLMDVRSDCLTLRMLKYTICCDFDQIILGSQVRGGGKMGGSLLIVELACGDLDVTLFSYFRGPFKLSESVFIEVWDYCELTSHYPSSRSFIIQIT